MAQAILKCEKCGCELIKDYGGKQKVRTTILIFEGGKCIAKCPRCKENCDVPVMLDLPAKPKPVKKKLRHVVMGVDRRLKSAL